VIFTGWLADRAVGHNLTHTPKSAWYFSPKETHARPAIAGSYVKLERLHPSNIGYIQSDIRYWFGTLGTSLTPVFDFGGRGQFLPLDTYTYMDRVEFYTVEIIDGPPLGSSNP